MYSAGSQQSNYRSNVGASSSSKSRGSITRPNPTPPMTPLRQEAIPSLLFHRPSISAPSIRGRSRDLHQLNTEIQLLQEELNSLDDTPPASKACKDLVAFVESRPDPFIPSSDGIGPQSWPYERPVKASRCCWKFK